MAITAEQVDTVAAVLEELRRMVQNMTDKVALYKNGAMLGGAWIELTDAQKTALIADYEQWKANVQAEFKRLP